MYGVRGKSRGRGSEQVRTALRYVPAAGDGQIWALLTATGARESTVPLSVIAAATVCSCPIFARVCVPVQQHQLPSTPHSGTCMIEFRRQKATFSIPDGQLTSALNPKLHFPQILSAKHPCHAARFPQSAPESFRSLDTTPGRTTPHSRATRFEHPCSQTPVLPHPLNPTAQRLLQGMVSFLVVITRVWRIPDLTRGLV